MSNQSMNNLVYTPPTRVIGAAGGDRARSSNPRLQLREQNENVQYSRDRTVEMDVWVRLWRYLRLTAAG